MPTYAENTQVPVERSRAEIERTLQRYGAGAFMYGWDQSQAVIGFDVDGRRYRISLSLPAKEDFTYTESGRARTSTQAIQSAWEQANRQRWRALSLWVKATLEAAEAGIVALEIALQPFTVLPSGQTVGQWMAVQIEDAYETGRMPALLPGLPERKD